MARVERSDKVVGCGQNHPFVFWLKRGYANHSNPRVRLRWID